jgi:hypothetical protein
VAEVIGYCTKQDGPDGFGFYYLCSDCYKGCSLCRGQGHLRGVFPVVHGEGVVEKVVCPACFDRWQPIHNGERRDERNGPPAGVDPYEPITLDNEPKCSECRGYIDRTARGIHG